MNEEEKFTDDPIPRSSKKFSSEEIKVWTDLHIAQPWLENKQPEFESLMGLCKSFDEQNLIMNLLYNFTYLRSSELVECLDNISKNIIEVWGLTPKNTLVIAPDNTDYADSSKAVLQQLKSRINRFVEEGDDHWHTSNFLTSMDSLVSKLNDNIKNIILIDEFVGTGNQMTDNVMLLNEKLEEYEGNKPLIRICVVASMEDGSKKIKELTKDYFYSTSVKKGISDYYSGEELDRAKALMIRLESELKDGYPSLGYSNSEALYGMEGGNTPNNVFPVFWWRDLKNGKKRLTILDRTS